VKVLVTGGAGYVGSVLVPLLLQRDHAVTVVDSLLFGIEPIARYLSDITVIPRDIRELTQTDLQGQEAVIHLGGLSNDPTADFNREANFEINTQASIELGRQSVQAGIERFVFGSTCSVYYTEKPVDTLFTEETVVHPTANYSESKHRAEQGLFDLQDDLCVTCFRKGTVFGLSPRMRFDLVVNTFTWYAHTKRRLTVHAGGRMWRPLLGIRDIARMYAEVLDRDPETISGQVFNLLTDNYRIIDLARMVQDTLSRIDVEVEMEVQEVGIPRSYKVCGEKAANVLGFQPDQTIEDAVLEMWQYLESRNNTYWNIKHLEALVEEGQLNADTLRRIP